MYISKFKIETFFKIFHYECGENIEIKLNNFNQNNKNFMA